MKINRQTKTITPTTALEVFDIWADPTTLDYDSGGSMCANFAAQRHAGVNYEAAMLWDLDFSKTGHIELFDKLNDAYDQYSAYSFLYGQDDADEEGRPMRPTNDAILRVAQAFAAAPEQFGLIVDEDEDGMLYVELTNQKYDRFVFTILEDYEMFWTFHKWREQKWASRREAERNASAERFLANLS